MVWGGGSQDYHGASPSSIPSQSHPTAEAQAQVAGRFKSKDDEVAAMTPEEYDRYVHPNLWHRFKQFWGRR